MLCRGSRLVCLPLSASRSFSFFFFFNDTATTEIYTLSLHDALPILHLHLPGELERLLVAVDRDSGRGHADAAGGHRPVLRRSRLVMEPDYGIVGPGGSPGAGRLRGTAAADHRGRHADGAAELGNERPIRPDRHSGARLSRALPGARRIR